MNRRELLKSIAAGTTTLFVVPSVLNGPAASPLRKYDITQEGDILTIIL